MIMGCVVLAMLAVGLMPAATSASAACCTIDKWQGRQITKTITNKYSAPTHTETDSQMTYDAVNERESFVMNYTDSDGNSERYNILLFYKKGMMYIHNLATGACFKGNTASFPKRCIPPTSQVTDPNVTLGSRTNKVDAKEVFYTLTSSGQTTYGTAVITDTCSPICEANAVNNYGTYTLRYNTFEDIKEGIDSEDIFDIPDDCNSARRSSPPAKYNHVVDALSRIAV